LKYEQLTSKYDKVIARFQGLLADTGPERERFPAMFTTIAGPFHGIHHWTRVGIYSLTIAEALRAQARVSPAALIPAGVLEDAVLWAAFFHDCARVTESVEGAHGRKGEMVWRNYAERKDLAPEIMAAVSQALLFHVDHPAVDPAANAVTICLCNADRLDRVRLGERPDPDRMYDDGAWRMLALYSERLLREVDLERVKRDLGL
jgi:hypothetical protein